MADYARPSTDLDITLSASGPDELRDLLARAAAEAESVGIRYEFGKTRTLYKPDGTAGGEKTKVIGWIGRTRVNFEVDAWFGGTRCPGMCVREAASIVPGLPPLRMLAYPPGSTVADKLHACVQFGAENTRLKDFYDLWHLSRRDLDPELLSECVRAAFANNARPIPMTPVLLPGFRRTYAAKSQSAWTKALAEAGRQDRAPTDFVTVVDAVRAFPNRAFDPALGTQPRRARASIQNAPEPALAAFA